MNFISLSRFRFRTKIKQALVLLIKLLIVGAAFYFIYNQLANSDPRLGEVHYFIQEESVGSALFSFCF
jgi:hypothetical protein